MNIRADKIDRDKLFEQINFTVRVFDAFGNYLQNSIPPLSSMIMGNYILNTVAVILSKITGTLNFPICKELTSSFSEIFILQAKEMYNELSCFNGLKTQDVIATVDRIYTEYANIITDTFIQIIKQQNQMEKQTTTLTTEELLGLMFQSIRLQPTQQTQNEVQDIITDALSNGDNAAKAAKEIAASLDLGTSEKNIIYESIKNHFEEYYSNLYESL